MDLLQEIWSQIQAEQLPAPPTLANGLPATADMDMNEFWPVGILGLRPEEKYEDWKKPDDSNIGPSLTTDAGFAYNTLTHVFKYLPYEDLLNCAEVCQLWQEIVQQQTIWEHITVYTCGEHICKLIRSPYFHKIRNLVLDDMVDSFDNKKEESIKFARFFRKLKQITFIDAYLNHLWALPKKTGNWPRKLYVSVNLYEKGSSEFITLGQFENITHLNLMSCSDNEGIFDAHFLKNLTKLKHLGLNLPCHESIWPTVVTLDMLESLELTDNVFHSSKPKWNTWITPLFGARFLIKELKSLKALNIRNLTFSHQYKILGRMKYLPNIEELVLSKKTVNRYKISNFGRLLGQCEHIKKLTISIRLLEDHSPSHFQEHLDTKNYLESMAMENYEILKGVLLLKNSLESFNFILYKGWRRLRKLYGNTEIILFKNFAELDIKKRTLSDAHKNITICSIDKVSKVLEEKLPNTKIAVIAPSKFPGLYKNTYCFTCKGPREW